MEVKVPRPRGRPRKRPRPEDDTGVPNGKLDNRGKRQVVEVKPSVPIVLLGCYVLKDFEDNGVFLGKIVSYDTGLYRVEYEDGDFEDLESRELRQLIVGENYFDDELSARKNKLNELIQKKDEKKKADCMNNKEVELKNQVNGVQIPAFSGPSGGLAIDDDGAGVKDDVDSHSDSSEYDDNRDRGIEAEVPLAPPLQLPPSSGTIGVPEGSVAHLLSVYGFLRSFSIHLFLYPFGLDDFVGALNFSAPNSLLDAVHVALLRALKRHLERLSSDGSELASKCLKCIDWGLLDALTWPVYLVQYFTAMGHATGAQWKIFYEFVMEKEYYSLPVGMKLKILQILCDGIFDLTELRAEIDIREESEVGFDPDGVTADLPENGPRRVHPRFAKTSACKEKEVIDIGAVNHGMNSNSKSKALGSKCSEDDSNKVSLDMDGNSDECRLCGMDGTLLCCDGCPSAYHSRCIGVVKMYIPEGPWYCPECTSNKTGPTIARGTFLRGAVFFGMDPHGRLFLGTCNHLLVLKTSINADSDADVRYYNVNDIPKVVVVLLSATSRGQAYVDVCKAILGYWNLPGNIISHLKALETGAGLVQVKKEEEGKVSDTIKLNIATSFSASHLQHKFSCSDLSIDKIVQTKPLGDIRTQDQPSQNLNSDDHIKTDSVASVHSVGGERKASDLRCQSLSVKLDMTGQPVCTSGSTSIAVTGRSSGVAEKNLAADVAYMGFCFKPHLYVNHYTNGEFAASAAATLAVLSSEDTHETDLQKYSNARKAASNNILLQLKAFSSVAARFFWPIPDKKDIARERCGWCHFCKLTSASRRGCMLNAAITGATKSAARIFTGLSPIKNWEGSLSSIAAYILYLEESLRGLISGPFLGESHRKQWRKQLEEASTCRTIKPLLLELEENICGVALSSDWFKLTDDWLIEHSIFQSAPSTAGTTQKRGPGRRRQKNQAETTAGGCDDDSFTWWRGGKLSKLILLKAVLSRQKIRKAACQGGLKRIFGFNYGDGSSIPKRSRESVWRAAVESSKNISQLALQVRYLDTNIRWSELVRPEQNPQDAKGPETEASVFRNACICDKKIIDNKVRYGVAFGKQKHLPSRVMKSVIDVEKTQDGNEKYWFQEARVPLYLIKEYEESLHRFPPLPSTKRPSNRLSKLQRKQLKASRLDIFSYLASRKENMEKCSCASCQLDVLLRDATTCSGCQGFCHKDCVLSSQYTNGKVEVLLTCKRCFYVKARSVMNINHRHPTTSLSVINGQHQNAMTPVTKTQIKPVNQQSTSLKTQESASGIKQVTPDSITASKSKPKTLSCGVIWRKKNCEDTGVDFRHENILLARRSDKPDLKPVCGLCQRPYNPGLSYIHCNNCNKWYHIEAVKLEESRIPEVVGFKCCKCRRIRSPDCPYMDPMLKEQKQIKKSTSKCQKQGQGIVGLDSDSERMSEPKDSKQPPLFPSEDVFVLDDDPLLLSISKVEQITDSNWDLEWNSASSIPGPQKLPVRRQVKREDNVESFSGNNHSHAEISTCPEPGPIIKPEEEQMLPVTEWVPSGNGVEGDLMFEYGGGFNYEDMEFEPQTYFSLTELLTTDDSGQCDGFSSNPQAEPMGQYDTYVSTDLSEMVNADASKVPCGICTHLNPAPDLTCQVCGLTIHSHCSPWEEESSTCPQGSWNCGRCREWR